MRRGLKWTRGMGGAAAQLDELGFLGQQTRTTPSRDKGLCQRAGDETRTRNLLCLRWVLINVGHYLAIVALTRAEARRSTFDLGHRWSLLGIVSWEFLGSYQDQLCKSSLAKLILVN
jgi:hypothetical protein